MNPLRPSIRLALLLLGLGLAAAPAAPGAAAKRDLAAELADAQAALAAGDYETAYAAYLTAAEGGGNPLAHFTLALFHQFGWGRPVDPAAACRWHEKAAAGEIPAAQHFLAQCLEQGTHRAADPAAAAGWYERAAQNGHVISLCDLAALHIEGRGLAQDTAKGLALCHQVATGDSNPAKLRMARFHLEGPDEIRDLAAAYDWLHLAAQSESAEAQYRLGLMLRDGLGREADSLAARFWFEQAAARGYSAAYLPTARLYVEEPADPATGHPPPEAVAKAYLWLSATLRATVDPEERAEAQAMLDRILAIMPASWIPELDGKVARHFETLGGS